MEIHIRRAAVGDAAALATIEVLSWQAAYQGLMPGEYLQGLSLEEKTTGWRQDLLEHEESGAWRLLVAMLETTIIGFARLGEARDEPDTGLVYLLYVHPQYWGRGAGSALMVAAMDELRSMGARQAVLWVLRDNLRARKFYESLGWRPDGRKAASNYGEASLEALCYRRTVAGDAGWDHG